MITNSFSPQKIALTLSQGNLVVIRTDTIYGILASATRPDAIQRLYTVRKRNPTKACILLVADVLDIPGLSEQQRQLYHSLSREHPMTIVQSIDDSYLPHVPRQNNTLAFRVVAPSHLKELIRLTGPLLAPSANPEGLSPATTIQQAIDYFGNSVSQYVDGGEVTKNTPSKIISLVDGVMQIIRQ